MADAIEPRTVMSHRATGTALAVFAVLLGIALSARGIVHYAAVNVASVAALKSIESRSDRTIPLATRAHAIAVSTRFGGVNDDAIVMSLLHAAQPGASYGDERAFSARASAALRGRRLWLAGDHAGAVALWRPAGVSELLVRLGGVQLARDRPAEALEYYQEALAIDPQSVAVWIVIGGLHEREQRWPEAEDAYKRAIALAPKDPRPYAAVAFLRWRRGLGDADTEKAFETAIAAADADAQHRADAELAWLYTDLALLYLQTGRAELAQARAEKAVRLDPGIPFAHYFLGEALRRTGDTRRAISELKSALDLGLTNEWARYSLALAYLDAGEIGNAEAEAERLRRAQPGFTALTILTENIHKAKKLR